MHQTFPKTTRLDDREAKRKRDLRHWCDVCRLVEHRDGMHCRACGRRVVKTLTVQPDRLEHHHVIPVSLGGEDSRQNVACLCLSCHNDRHVTRTLHIRGNADRVLQFEQDGKTWRQ